QLQETLRYQKIHGGRISAALVALGFVSEQTVADVLARHYGVSAIDLSTAEVDVAAIKLLPQDVARRHNAVPIGVRDSTLIVAIADPNNLAALDELRFVTGHRVRVVVAPYSQIQSAITTLYAAPQSTAIEKLTEELTAGDTSNANVELVEGEP